LTTINTLSFAAWLHYQRGEHDVAAEITQQVLDIGSAHGFSTWLDVALVLQYATTRPTFRRSLGPFRVNFCRGPR